jgi:hypothetical protein
MYQMPNRILLPSLIWKLFVISFKPIVRKKRYFSKALPCSQLKVYVEILLFSFLVRSLSIFMLKPRHSLHFVLPISVSFLTRF